MDRPRLLDLYCKAGGCTRGYQQAGFYVVGVDIEPQPHYVGDEFIQADVLTLDIGFLQQFDAIHASPPCQAYSRLRHLPWLKDKVYPALIEPTRNMLVKSGKPWSMENVEGAPLNGFVLCGQSFGLPVYRHRLFETNFFVLAPTHDRHRVVIGHGRMVNDRRKGTLNAGSSKGAWGNQQVITVAGGQCSKADAARALDIDWMNKDELCQAIPPAYTKFIGDQLMKTIKVNR